MAVRRAGVPADNALEQPLPTTRKLSSVVLNIGGSLALGSFLVWIVTVGWVLNLIAGIILFGVVILGFFVGREVYRFLSPTLYQWERMTIAIILGLAVALAVGELLQSHQLIRDYHNYSSDNDDD